MKAHNLARRSAGGLGSEAYSMRAQERRGWFPGCQADADMINRAWRQLKGAGRPSYPRRAEPSPVAKDQRLEAGKAPPGS